MSALIYFASNNHLKKITSPHHKTMSVNEALRLGIEIPDMLNLDQIDKDEPDMLLWSDSYVKNEETEMYEDSGFDDDISITPMNGKTEDILTEKKYCASLSWPGYTKGRAQQLIAYIKEHLKYSPEIELWHIWMGKSYPTPDIKKTYIRIEDLDTEAIKKLYECSVWETESIACHVQVPHDWNIAEDEMNRDIHYCYVIVSSHVS